MAGNAVSVDGSENRTAGRDYLEVTYAAPATKGPLTWHQRRQLNEFVDDVAAACSVRAWELWQQVHQHFGVASIGEMTGDQYQPTRELLSRYRDENNQGARRALMDRIRLAMTQRGIIDRDIDHYCMGEFGRAGLDKLQRSELQRLLNHVETRAASTEAARRLSLDGLVLAYPVHSVVIFAAGLLVGWIV